MQQDFVALQWVGGEIDEIAGQFGKAVLGFADNVSDQTRLRLGLTQAHQLHATLRLLGVPSAEQLAREIEDTVQAMLHGRIEPSGTNLQLLLAARACSCPPTCTAWPPSGANHRSTCSAW
jgi:chemotaxis protein histidine kinase CheA